MRSRWILTPLSLKYLLEGPAPSTHLVARSVRMLLTLSLLRVRRRGVSRSDEEMPIQESSSYEGVRLRDPDKAQRGAENRLVWLRLVLVAGLVAGLLLSPNLWISTRSYPLTPLWDAVPPLPYPADHTLFGLLMVLVTGVGVARGRAIGWLGISALVIAAFFVVQDESRLQP